MSTLQPSPEHKFAFGLWTIGHSGRDTFGDVVRPPIEPWEFVYRLGDLGGWGVSFHDDDLVPPEATCTARDSVVSRFHKALESTGLVVSMATTNLFWHPVFKDGAFTSNDRDVRRFAVQKAMRAIDLGAELGAQVHVFRGGREGAEAVAAKPPLDALARYREAIDFLCAYVGDRGYGTRLALAPKPNETPGDSLLPTIGHALAFIATLDRPDMVGLNPEVAARDDGRTQRVPRGRPGDRRREAVPHRPQRPTERPLRPGPALRLRGAEGRLLPRQAARRVRLRRAPSLRRPALSRRGRRGCVGLRQWLHAHLSRSRGEGAAVRRRPRDPGRPRRVRGGGAGRRHCRPIRRCPPPTPWPPSRSIPTSSPNGDTATSTSISSSSS